MIRLSITLALLATASPTFAQSSHAIRGHVTASGVYVAPTRATNPTNARLDNYSSRPNVNPYSGRVGTVDPYKMPTYKPPRTR